jgi:hypothetical protein
VGEGTSGVSGTNARRSPEEIEREIVRVRNQIGGVLHELKCRRRELTDWRMQLGRKRGKIGTGIRVLTGALAVTRFIRKHRERKEAERRRELSPV